jgi:CspA family cold shock protein
VISHRVERKYDKLRVTLDLDLGELLSRLPLPDSPYEDMYYRRVMNYLLERVGRDIFEVGQILLDEGETGVVKWFDERKGYGFIRSADHHDVFVHYRGIKGEGFKTLAQGQRVRFKRREGKETLEAIDVEPV